MRQEHTGDFETAGTGAPFLPITALLITYHFTKKAGRQEHSFTHLIASYTFRISLMLKATFKFLLFSTRKSTGLLMSRIQHW